MAQGNHDTDTDQMIGMSRGGQAQMAEQNEFVGGRRSDAGSQLLAGLRRSYVSLVATGWQHVPTLLLASARHLRIRRRPIVSSGC